MWQLNQTTYNNIKDDTQTVSLVLCFNRIIRLSPLVSGRKVRGPQVENPCCAVA